MTPAVAVLLAALVFGQSPPEAARGVVADTRDRYTLFTPHPVNRQLFEQTSDPAAAFRLGPRDGPWTALVDASIGTQHEITAEKQSRFHGYFMADTYLAVRPVEGIDFNLNLLLLNPSASDGYRVSAMLHPGVALHLERDLFSIGESPLRFDILATDLGWVTTGNGLLVESTPLEGLIGLLRWKDWELKYMFAGRVYWDTDDYQSLTLSTLGNALQATMVEWWAGDPAPSVFLAGSDPEAILAATPTRRAHYATLAAGWPAADWLHLAAELGCRIEGKPRVGALGRADVVLREDPRYALHVGYQFRFYQAGFGPRGQLITPSWVFNTPDQQDAYVTNPFEYFGLSGAYHQWSHTIMAEARLGLGLGLEAFGDGELWIRYARSATVPRFAAFTADGFRAPGSATRFFYQAGLRYYPWSNLPHRVSLQVTNKQVQVLDLVTDPVDRRFDPGVYWLLMGEVFL
ncbi:MAG TPA: hypothetical protein VF417_04305 [Candidatus Methylomirabilis sp.]